MSDSRAEITAWNEPDGIRLQIMILDPDAGPDETVAIETTLSVDSAMVTIGRLLDLIRERHSETTKQLQRWVNSG